MELLYFVLTGLGGLGILLLGEWGWDRGWWRGEWARKFVHTIIGMFVATWPFYLSWDTIRIISVVLFFGFIIAMRLRLFRSIGGVARLSFGEVLFALVIGLLTMISMTKGIYAAAILHLALADSAAAVAGVKWGKSTQYTVLGQTKSIVGSSAFLVVSLMLCIGFGLLHPGTVPLIGIVAISLSAMALENIGVYGLDNLFVPVAVAAALSFIV